MSALAGRVAVVTGAGRGIGREEALFLASQGARVLVNDMGGSWDGEGSDERPASEVVDMIRAVGGEATANFSDVSTEAGADELIAQALDELGDLHILVNNAGILRDGMLFNIDPKAWRSVIDVHILGHFLPTRRAAMYWRSKAKELGGDGPPRTLVNTSSESGLFGTAGQTNYDIAKLGIASFTIAAATELAKYNVTSNAIAPRARTRLTTSTFDGSSREQDFKEYSDTEFDAMDPANIAPFVGFLASDAARHITGQTFIIYGKTIGRVRLPHLESIIVSDDRWTVEDISSHIGGLFTDLPADHREGPLGYAGEIPM